MIETKDNTSHPHRPPQKLSLRRKTAKWREQNIDAIDGLATFMHKNGRTSRYKKQTNYNLLNSIFDKKDYSYVLDPYNLNNEYGDTPARMRDINLVRQKVDLLAGEELVRPFKPMIAAVNGEAITIKEEKKKEMLFELAKFKFYQEVGMIDEETGQPKTDENGEPLPPPPFQTFEEIEKHMNTSYTDVREEWANHILKHLTEEDRLQEKFNDGFRHGLVSSEEIYYVGLIGGEPRLRVVNPLNFEWDKNPDNPRIEDSDWAREERWLSVGQVLDEYGEFLSDEQVRILDEGYSNYGSTMSRNKLYPGFGYTQDVIRDNDIYNHSEHQTDFEYIRVITCTWKSMKKIGFKTLIDPKTGEEVEDIIEEGEKLSEEEILAGATVEWQWISEVWMGHKIGNDIFVDINPVPNQMRSMVNPSTCKLPYVGGVYNSFNSSATSLVDLLKPHQYLYNIVWYRLENELAKAKGKKMVMDLAQIPKSAGFDLKKWMYYFDNMGIAWINSFEEGKQGTRFQGQTSHFNQYQAIDMTLSNTIQQYMGIMDKLEQLMDSISGVSRQREGAIHQNETAAGVERSLSQSSYITEHYFFKHDEIKRQVCQHLIELSKYAYSGGKKINYITSDKAKMLVEIDGERYLDSDYGVYVTNTAHEKLVRSKVENLAQVALQQGKVELSDLIKLFKSQSTSEMATIIRDGEDEKNQRDQQMQEQQNQIQQQQIETQKQMADEARAFEAEQNQLDREMQLQKAVIQATGFDTEKDRDGDGVADVLETGEDMLAVSQLQADKENNARTRLHESSEKEKDRDLKREEIKSKEKIEELKAKTALKNKVSGEK